MTNEVLNTLNEEQLIALKQIDGPVLVTAGAGSGKTRLLTHRIVYLIENFGINPYNILAITFTNKAAGEMKTRIEKLCPEGKHVWISTFHSMCVRILREHISRLDPRFNANFSIYADTESEKVVKTLLAEENITDDKIKKNVLFHLSNMKNNNISFSKYKQDLSFDRNGQLITRIMAKYQNVLTENNALDFDDLMVKTFQLFVQCEDVKMHYAERFKYILVDEFQDTNVLQYDLVKLLASVHNNVFVVGDEDQCIYTWRGANFKNISNFKKDFLNVQVYKLERNYRSTKTILDCANKLIKHNTQRIDKTLWSDASQGEPIDAREIYDEQNEADFVASTIHDYIKNKGYSYSDFAILLRLNALSLPFEEKLLAYNIPHKIYGGFKFYERVEIKNVLAYLKLFINPKDEQAFVRIVNFPRRGIGETSLQKLKLLAIDNQTSMLDVALNPEKFDLQKGLAQKLEGFSNTYKNLLQVFDKTTLFEFAKKVVDEFGVIGAFNQQVEEELNKVLNIQQLLHSIEEYAHKNPDDTLNDYLQSVSLISDMDSMDDSDNVIVATVHAVKGLEFRAVFLPALEEKIFPISRAVGDDDQMEEERRLLYVGITRAKEKLFMSHCKTRFLYGHRDYMAESRFLADCGFGNKFASKQTFNNSPSRTSNSQVDFGKFSSFENNNIGSNFKSPSFNKNFGGIVEPKIETPKGELKFKVNQKVKHARYGIGVITEIDYEERTGDIDFESVGVKTLMLDIAPLEIVE